MAASSDDLLISVSTDLTTVKRQLKQLVSDIGTATGGIQKQFDSVGRGIDKSMTTALQARINDMVGIGAKAGKEWNGVLADQGRELESLRAKYSPLFAAQQTYLNNLKNIKMAQAIGAISGDEMSAAIAREKAAFTGNVIAINTHDAAMQKVRSTAKLTANQMLNLSRQGNDVITMFALGAPPMQIFASQAGQIYDALEQGPNGVKGSLKAIGESALGLVTKFPLATAAIAAAGVAFLAYQAYGGSSLKTLDEILKNHEENIKRLGDAYDVVATKQHKYASDTANTVNALNEKNVQDLKNLLGAQVKEVFDSIYKTIGAGGGNQGPLSKTLISTFEPFQAAIEKLAEGTRNGTPDIKAFRDEVTNVAKTDPSNLNAARDTLLAITAEATKTADALPIVSAAVSGTIDVVDQFNRALANVDSKPVQDELQALFDKALAGREPIEGILIELAKLEQANPSFAGILSGFQGILAAAANTAAALDNLGSHYFANQGTPTNGRQKLPVGLLPDTAPTPDFAPNREDLGHEYDKAVEAAQRKADAAARRANRPQQKTSDDRFAEDIQAIKDRTAALNEEISTLGLSFEEQTKRKTSLDLEQEALKQVREEARKKGDADWQSVQLSPQQVQAINDVSAAYAKQAEELRKAQEMYDLQRDVLKGAFDDMRSALDDGKLSWQDFGNIAMNALDKIIDKIENDLIDAIMQANSAGGGGSGGILGGLFSLLGLGGGSSFNPTSGGFAQMLGIPGYANGTDNHPGGLAVVGEKGPELLNLPRGSQVIPKMPMILAPANQNSAGYNDNRQITIDARGAQKGVGEEIKRALAEYDKSSIPRTLSAIRTAKIRGMV
ncbi:phage tail length tape measure family protein [Mesorhizobium sp. NZP2234]|uniref:phage tail length tape measure family protein n=1 Tax=Mesorhizobium sp. NZP2234 TaxID=2483402 RepID=UPI00155673A9|nr:phage tail length tape measure family protein [Mesorhizobium sp. NZP2234]